MRARLSTLTGLVIAAGASAAIATAPAALANPLLPDCEVTGAGGGMQGGQTTDCASPGNVQIDSTPPDYGMGFPWEEGPWIL